ncbi:hypothetical protein CUZ56_00540 [Saezia sanguinis]|uniref:SHSP domain-containing protein n=1 Tax=Saezia sanguinis TaxID=1965230 RepID=A0A433SH72_9BURK|nr:Hsp20/alpha crystallin family protein [Saezia sanguinis]RUS68056.1 hypothetical protein CUZ56_00540 [Saezia sanguinis]
MFLVPTLRRAYSQDSANSAINGFENELARWFGRAVEPGFSTLTEKDGVWEVSLDIPGVSREQLSIDIDGRKVKIQTQEGAPRQYASAFVLPAEVDPAASEAKLENGVLTLKLARKVEEKTSTQLTIN